MEVRYAPGDGVLVSRSQRWLLLGTGPAQAPAPLLDQLWDDLAQPAARALALATVRRHLPGVAVAWLDGASGDHLAESGATAVRHGDRWELAVEPSSAPARMRLVDGVVAAGSVQVVGAVPLADGGAVAPTGVVIDGIPTEILRAGREGPPVAAPTRPDSRPEPDTDHDHRTVVRSAAPPPVGEPGHLEQSTSDTVLAVRCRRGHLTDPLAAACRTCGGPVTAEAPQRVLRPALGVLRLPDRPDLVLDRPVVLGRRPTATGPGDWPHLVQLPHDSTYLSRRHLRIELDGWHVLAEDLASRGGTTVFAPGRDPEKIRAHEPYLLEHGTTLDLAGAYQVTFWSRTEEDA